MSQVTRLGDITEGHCFPPRGSDTASSDVLVNGIPVVTVGDHYPAHTCGTETHDGVLAAGSSSVFVNGKPVGRVGDPVSCGDKVAQGSPDVIVGG